MRAALIIFVTLAVVAFGEARLPNLRIDRELGAGGKQSLRLVCQPDLPKSSAYSCQLTLVRNGLGLSSIWLAASDVETLLGQFSKHAVSNVDGSARRLNTLTWKITYNGKTFEGGYSPQPREPSRTIASTLDAVLLLESQLTLQSMSQGQ